MKLLEKVFTLFIFLIFAFSNLYPQSAQSKSVFLEYLRTNPYERMEIKDKSSTAIIDSFYVASIKGYYIPLEKNKYVFDYDSNNNRILELKYIWDENSWVNTLVTTNTFDSNNNIISSTMQEWRDSLWTNSIKHTYVYDSENNLINKFWSRWSSNAWETINRYTYNYNSSGNEILELTEYSKNGTWIPSGKIATSYDSTDNITSKVWFVWGDSAWYNSSRYIFVYNSDKKMTNKYWDSYLDNAWTNSENITYSYDSDGILSTELIELWNDSTWYKYHKVTYSYDSSSKIVSKVTTRWDSLKWTNQRKSIYEYNSNGNMVHGVNKKWKCNYWDISNGYFKIMQKYELSGFEVVVYYKTTTDIGIQDKIIASYSLSQNYPNPFNPSTTISYTLPKNGFVQLRIYDLLGQEVANLVNKEQTSGTYKLEFNASNLTSGVYLYRLQSGSFAETKKLILLK